jgi:hypothetical protein
MPPKKKGKKGVSKGKKEPEAEPEETAMSVDEEVADLFRQFAATFQTPEELQSYIDASIQIILDTTLGPVSEKHFLGRFIREDDVHFTREQSQYILQNSGTILLNNTSLHDHYQHYVSEFNRINHPRCLREAPSPTPSARRFTWMSNTRSSLK